MWSEKKHICVSLYNYVSFLFSVLIIRLKSRSYRILYLYYFWTEKTPQNMPPKKKRKILTSEEVLKDIQKFFDEEDNENISDEDVNLD